jgi:hypothetical protein
MKEQLSEHGFLFFTFTVMFAWAVISAWDVPNFGANPGHWRYLLSIAPLTAIYAAKGVNAMFEGHKPVINYAILGVFTAISFAFLARETNGFVLIDQARYDHVFVIAAILLVYAAYASLRILSAKVVSALLIVTLIGFTVYAEKPRKLDDEAGTVKQAAEWYLAQPKDFQQRPLYGNHVLFRYFADISINDTNRDRGLRLELLDKSVPGSVIVWDSHYGNSQFGGDVPMEYFQEHPYYKLLKQFVDPDQRFGVLVFEKTAEAGGVNGTGVPAQGENAGGQ